MTRKHKVYLGSVMLIFLATSPAHVLAEEGKAGAETRGCCQHQGQGEHKGNNEQGTPGCCQHQGRGGHKGKGRDAEHHQDMQGFHFLLAHRAQIRREVTKIPNGVETVTESDDPEVAAKLYEHVEAMSRRITEQRPIHRRDPLFAEIFRHGDKINMEFERTDTGIKVKETAEDPYVVKLIHAHAEVISLFLANGRAEMHKNHPVPPR
ncbi:MAG: hypothetical protein AB7G75_11215 [Candidatus Binatia bacterium]